MNNESKNVTAPVDVLAVMERDDNDARKHRIANQQSFPMGARINAALESESARAAVAELMRLALAIDAECGNAKPDFGRVVALASEAAALARAGGAG